MRTKLTDDEFNAISKLTMETHLDQVFDVYDNDKEDMFIDREEEILVDLKTGLDWLYDGLSYPLKHDWLNEEQAKLVRNLFVEFEIETYEKTQWLMEGF